MARSSLPWFRRWAPALQKHVDIPWPSRQDSEFWAGVEAALADNWASEAEADAILTRLARTIQFKNQVAREIEMALKGHRAIANASRSASGGPEPGSREEAEANSAGCPDCGGKEGYAIRRLIVRDYDADGSDGEPWDLAMPCLCPVGRWIAGRLKHGGTPFFDLVGCTALWIDATHPTWPEPPHGEWAGSLPILRLKSRRRMEVIGSRDPIRARFHESATVPVPF